MADPIFEWGEPQRILSTQMLAVSMYVILAFFP